MQTAETTKLRAPTVEVEVQFQRTEQNKHGLVHGNDDEEDLSVMR
jgi:hypothetical protein